MTVMDNSDSKGFIEKNLTTVRKLTFNMIPGGSVLEEIFFERYGRIKQDRVNSFVESFLKYLNFENIDLSKADTERFGDVFEIIIRKVSRTKSQSKIERFKKILANEVVNPFDTDFKETFLDIVGQLHDMQIKILIEHLKIQDDYNQSRREYKSLSSRNAEEEGRIDLIRKRNYTKDESYFESIEKLKIEKIKEQKIEDYIKKLNRIRKARYYALDEDLYLFFVQDLYSKSLIKDIGIGAIGTSPFEIMEITEFGIGFLKFIDRKQNDVELQSIQFDQ